MDRRRASGLSRGDPGRLGCKYVYVYIYIYMCVCVCACVSVLMGVGGVERGGLGSFLS